MKSEANVFVRRDKIHDCVTVDKPATLNKGDRCSAKKGMSTVHNQTTKLTILCKWTQDVCLDTGIEIIIPVI